MLTAALRDMSRSHRALVAAIATEAGRLLQCHGWRPSTGDTGLTLMEALKGAVTGLPLPQEMTHGQWYRYRLARRACLDVVSDWTLTGWADAAGRTKADVLGLLANVASLARHGGGES